MNIKILGYEIHIIKIKQTKNNKPTKEHEDYNGCSGSTVGRGYGGDITIN